MADKQISDLTSASAMTDGSLFVIEQGGAAKSANWGMIKNYISPANAPLFSASASYAVNDYVIYNANLYRFTAAKAAGAWDSSKVTQTTVGAELTALHSPSALAPVYSASSTYPVGAYVFHDGILYRCTTAISTAETWTAAHWTQVALAGDVADLKNALSVKTGISESSKADTSGTSTALSKRLRLNETPIPKGALLGVVKMIPYVGSGTAKGVFELATLSGGTYTVYRTVQFSIDPLQTSALQDVVNLNTVTTAPTYVFITVASDATSKFRVNSSTGKNMIVGDEIANASFTTRSVSNYEIAYSLSYIYSELQEDVAELQNKTNDINTIRTNANKVYNYPFSTEAVFLTVGAIDFANIRNAIKDLRLFGADPEETYWIYTYLVNYNGNYSIEIRKESTNSNVCGFTVTTPKTGLSLYELKEQNGSGITGWVLWDASAFTSSYYFSSSSATTIAKECIEVIPEFDYKYLIDNVICMGDSLTQGYIKSGYVHTKNSYPTILKKLCNAINVINQGASGFTAKQYYENNIVGHPSWYPFADCSYAILWLGTNAGLDTEEQQTAYNNIINAIQTGNANIKLFLCTVFSTTGTSKDDTNDFIKSKNLPVIDMDVYPFNASSDTRIHPYDGTHFGDVGYMMVAEYITKQISEYINRHKGEYNLISGIGLRCRSHNR